MTKAQLKKIYGQVAGIVATAGVAASLAFIQSIAAQNGLTCTPTVQPEVAGGFGIFLRTLALTLPSIGGVKLS